MSKVISADTFATTVQSWQQPELLGEVLNPAPEPTISEEVEQLGSQEIEKIKKQAYAEGLARGKKAGLLQGQAEGKVLIENELSQINKVLDAFDEPLKQLDDEVEKALLELSIAIAKQVVRRELKMDPGQVIAVIREALAQLPSGALFTRLFLHPEDAVFVKEALSLEGQTQSIEVRDDPSLSRGGCRLETDTSQIDASVEYRIAEIAASVLGGERHDDGGQ